MSGAIVGQVVDAGGEAVAEAVVMVAESPGSHPDIAQLTDAAGRFRLIGLAPGRYRLAVRGGGELVESEVIEVGEGPTSLQIRLG